MDASNYNLDCNKLNHNLHVANRPEVNSPMPMSSLDNNPTTATIIQSAPRITRPIPYYPNGSIATVTIAPSAPRITRPTPCYPDGSIALKHDQLQLGLKKNKKHFSKQIPKNLDLTNIFPGNSLNRLSNPDNLSSPMDLIEPKLNRIQLPTEQEITKQKFKFNHPQMARQLIHNLNHHIGQPRLGNTRSRSI